MNTDSPFTPFTQMLPGIPRMRITLPSGFKIAIPPFFFMGRQSGLKIHSRCAFYPAHATSRMCLELLDQSMGTTAFRSMLDIGCGSGILALTAAALGVPFTMGLDVDARAVEVSRYNARVNGLDSSCQWVVGTADAVRGTFSCITANLPMGILRECLKDVFRLVEPGGHVILSGFHDLDWREIRARLEEGDMEVVMVCSRDLSFSAEPPSGSYTWMGVLARHGGGRET